jgi:hypothetical protein
MMSVHTWDMQRIAFVAVAAGLGAVCGCGDDSPNADGSSACRYDTGPPLTHHLEQPERVILARARRILRHAATSDRRSGLVQVLAGSRYREEAIGTWEPSSHAGVIGATIEIALDRPRPVDAVVSSAGEAWPRSSPTTATRGDTGTWSGGHVSSPGRLPGSRFRSTSAVGALWTSTRR